MYFMQAIEIVGQKDVRAFTTSTKELRGRKVRMNLMVDVLWNLKKFFVE